MAPNPTPTAKPSVEEKKKHRQMILVRVRFSLLFQTENCDPCSLFVCSVHPEQHPSPLMSHLSHLKCLSCILEVNAIQIESEKVTLHDVSMSVFVCLRCVCVS